MNREMDLRMVAPEGSGMYRNDSKNREWNGGRGLRPRIGARLTIGLAMTLTIVMGSIMFGGATPAFAGVVHAYSFSFGSATSSPTDPYPLTDPTSTAVDNSSGTSSGDIYVTDPENHRVEKFDSSGNFILMFGKDVNQTTGGNVCPEAPGDVCQAGTEGSGPGEFEAPNFVAVDPTSGDVYVGDGHDEFASVEGAGTVQKFEPTGILITSWASGGELSGLFVQGLAVDGSENLYVLGEEPYVEWFNPNGTLHSDIEYPRGTDSRGLAVDSDENFYKIDGSPEVTKFSRIGEDLADSLDPETGENTGLAIDPSTNDLYVTVEGKQVDRFALDCGQNCQPIEEFGSGHLDEAEGLGISSQSDVYVANTGEGDIAKFESKAVPDAVTKAPSNLKSTSATLNGHIDPAGTGEITGCEFEYTPIQNGFQKLVISEATGGTFTLSYGGETTAPIRYNTGGGELVSRLEEIPALKGEVVRVREEIYYSGTEEREFKLEFVGALAETAVAELVADGSGLDPSGASVSTETVRQGHGWKEAKSASCMPEPPFSGPANVTALISELEPFTIYHVRMVVTNAEGPYTGGTSTFRSPGVPIMCRIPGRPGYGTEWEYKNCKSFIESPSTTQAGGHPNITVNYAFGYRDSLEFPTNCFCQDPENIETSLPTGVIGDPHATPYCSRVEFATFTCDPSTQVGFVLVNLFGSEFDEPLYNLEPDPQQAGLFGFFAPLAQSAIYTEVTARTGSDYGLDLNTVGIEHIIPPEEISYELWGVPAESGNDAHRYPPGKEADCYGGLTEPTCNFKPTPSDSEPIPFLDNPTTCSESDLGGSLEILAFDGGVSTATASYPSTTGCDQLSFNPSLYAQPTTKQTDSASGLEVDLSVPQTVSPTTPSPSEIRSLTMTLPKGMSINPNAADGKGVCSDAEGKVGSFASSEAAECPEFSKIGSVTLTSAALPGPISGFAYLGEPKPRERYRVILSASGFATNVKLAGTVQADPETGQLVVTFDNLPQSPFSDFDVHFFGSERGLLATPTQCGKYAVESKFRPWDSALPEQTSTQYFQLESGPDGAPCPEPHRPFSPTVRAGVAEATAGAHSPFSFQLTRADGDQGLSALNISTPPGFSATLTGIPYCPDAALEAAALATHSAAEEIASPSCPPSSQIGTAQTGAGAGTHPLYVAGKVYLAGPYKGAPLSLAVITPAISGPYDLGNVVVRAGLHVNPESAQITAVSDPLPSILGGIPLRLRSIRINLDRQNFILNPTNCSPFLVSAEVFGDQGAVATPSEHFQVANCNVLPFSPRLALSFSGPRRRAKNPWLTATVSANPGEANIARTVVTLPHSEIVDNAHIQTPCTGAQFREAKCPTGSVIGSAKAESPLLEKPLEGPVYLRVGTHKLPDIVAALKGQIEIDLVGHVDTVKGRIRTTFESVPDVPVTQFTLNLAGGEQGLLQNDENLCKQRQVAIEEMTGQNGRTADHNTTIPTGCPAKKHKTRRRHRRDLHIDPRVR